MCRRITVAGVAAALIAVSFTTSSAGTVGKRTNFELYTPAPCGVACGDLLPAPFGPCGTVFPDPSVDEIVVRAPAGASTLEVEWYWFPSTEHGARVYVCEDEGSPAARPATAVAKGGACVMPQPWCTTGNAYRVPVTAGKDYRIRGFNALGIGNIEGTYTFLP